MERSLSIGVSLFRGWGIQQCPTEGEGGVGAEGEGLTYLDTYLQGVIPREGYLITKWLGQRFYYT